MHIKYEKIEGPLGEKLDELFGVKGCLIEVNPGKVLVPPKFEDIGERIMNMEVRPDDIWLISYPRTGSTWAQEMVWCIGNDLNYEGANVLAQLRTPLLELTAILGNDPREWKDALGDSVDLVENMPSPRFIKTHLPWDLLPKQLHQVKPKIIYVARNPKDICVSYFHFCKLIHDFRGTFQQFADLMLQGKTPIGSFWDHVMPFWSRRDEPNFLFLKYEEMKKDHREAIIKAADFLGKKFSEEEIQGLKEHLSFNKMRENPAINLEPILDQMYGPTIQRPEPENKFIRKGQVGDWKNHMDEKTSEKFDKWIEENLKGTNLVFE